jgi:hypothetical protein
MAAGGADGAEVDPAAVGEQPYACGVGNDGLDLRLMAADVRKVIDVLG